jgi:hypothetical protein
MREGWNGWMDRMYEWITLSVYLCIYVFSCLSPVSILTNTVYMHIYVGLILSMLNPEPCLRPNAAQVISQVQSLRRKQNLSRSFSRSSSLNTSLHGMIKHMYSYCLDACVLFVLAVVLFAYVCISTCAYFYLCVCSPFPHGPDQDRVRQSPCYHERKTTSTASHAQVLLQTTQLTTTAPTATHCWPLY